MHKVMYTNASQYVSNRDGVFYNIRRVPNDVRQHYASSRISFSLRTKSLKGSRTFFEVSFRFWDGMNKSFLECVDKAVVGHFYLPQIEF